MAGNRDDVELDEPEGAEPMGPIGEPQGFEQAGIRRDGPSVAVRQKIVITPGNRGSRSGVFRDALMPE